MRLKFILIGICVLAPACGSGTEVSRPKNLLVIAIDTLRADALGAYGADPARTPNIDALAASGVVFENAVSHASWTLPSFASMLTSTYTSTHGCWDKDARLPASFQTWPEVFQAAGFDTYGIASHIFFNQKYGLQQGFDDFDESLGHAAGEQGWEPLTSPIISAGAEQWLEGRVGKQAPWLLWLHYFDPHIPYVDHSKRMGGPALKDEREQYFSEIHFTDEFVGNVLAALEANGFSENTAIVLLSDHGEAFYEHEGVRRHSHSLFTEELRIPLILSVPGLQARRVPGLTRSVDLMPTLLELFGLRAEPGQMIGANLMPSLRGAAQTSAPLLAEIRLKPAPEGKHRRALMDGRWKLIEGMDGSHLLFDQVADPLEAHDLALQQPAELQRLLRMMDALQAEAEAHAKAFEPSARVEHTQAEAAQLDSLGYGVGGQSDEDGD